MKGIGETSQWVAAMRSLESQRPDRLFVDEYARVLAGDGYDQFERIRQRGGMTGNPVLLRTCASNRTIADVLAGGVRQFVLLGAGLDARGLRPDLPADVDWFEVDLPEVFDYKEPLLAGAGARPGARRHLVRADLGGDWYAALAAAGHRPERTTVWLAEGVLGFLSPDVVDRLAVTTAAHSSPDSILQFDAFPAAYLRQSAGQALMAELGPREIPLPTTMENPAGWAAEHGWTAEAYSGREFRAGACPWLDDLPPRVMDDRMDLAWIVRCTRTPAPHQ